MLEVYNFFENSQHLQALWNIPASNCPELLEDLLNYDIKDEKTKHPCRIIATLYKSDIDFFPYFKEYPNGQVEKVNGGIPQVIYCTITKNCQLFSAVFSPAQKGSVAIWID